MGKLSTRNLCYTQTHLVTGLPLTIQCPLDEVLVPQQASKVLLTSYTDGSVVSRPGHGRAAWIMNE